MGSIDLIYGSIFSYVGGQSHPDYARRISETLWALELLPVEDDYPPLTRNMFSLTASRYAVPGLYQKLVIHFGLTVKNIEEEWDTWLDKFESVLEIIEWREARAHLEFEYAPDGLAEKRFDYRWAFPHGAGRTDRASWEFEGGPREFGGRVPRARAHALEMKRRLAASPEDAASLRSLIDALSRLRAYDELLEYWERLESIDREAADSIPYETLVSWGELRLWKGYPPPPL
jgi:hypothetical protein